MGWQSRNRDPNLPSRAAFPKLLSSRDHFYQSECSTDPPTLVPFESKLFRILNYSVWYAIHVNFIFFCLFWTNVQTKRTTRAEPEDLLWSTDNSLGNADLGDVTELRTNRWLHLVMSTKRGDVTDRACQLLWMLNLVNQPTNLPSIEHHWTVSFISSWHFPSWPVNFQHFMQPLRSLCTQYRSLCCTVQCVAV
jgi:hypothetical protein